MLQDKAEYYRKEANRCADLAKPIFYSSGLGAWHNSLILLRSRGR